MEYRSWCYSDEHSEASHQLIEELMVLAPDTKRGSKNSTFTSTNHSQTSCTPGEAAILTSLITYTTPQKDGGTY